MALGRRNRRRQRTAGRGSYSATAGLHFDDVELERRLVWIWTMARSGSTWFLKMLSHPLRLVDSSQDAEDMIGFWAPPAWQGKVDAIPVDTTFIANHLLPQAGKSHYLDDGSPVSFGSALGLTQRGNYFFSSKYEDTWKPELRRMMLVRFQALIESAAERYEVDSPLILLKEVAGAHAAPLIMSMFPRSRMLFLVRDGRDVVDSQTAANKPGGWLPVSGWSTDEERSRFIANRARTWVGDVASIERAYDAHPDELRRFVRYEDLLADAGGAVGPLVEWLGLRRNDAWLERSVESNSFSSISDELKGQDRFFRSASPGAWRSNMSAADGAELESILGPTLRRLGYEAGGSGAAGEPAASTAPPAGEEDPDPDPDPSPGSEATAAAEAAADPPNWGQSPRTDVLSATMTRQGAGRDFAGLGPLVTRRGGAESRRARRVALTFDDGPVLQTYDALETLERAGARGTFLLVGRKIAGHEPLIERILAGGHEIGNHSFAHTPYPSVGDDVAINSAVLERLTGAAPALYRPPFGAIDRPGAEAAIEAGLRVLLWNVDSEDGVPPWEGIPADRVVANVLERVTPGSVILLHDGLAWSRAVDALPRLVEGLGADGYEMVTVSELLDDAEKASPARRLLGRSSGAAGRSVPAGASDGAELPARRTLRDVVAWLAEGIEPPSGEEPWQRLVADAVIALDSDAVGGSPVLARNVGALENDSVRIAAVGFALRIATGAAAPGLDDAAAGRLRDSGDAVTEAGAVARGLARPTRVDRLVKAELKSRKGEESSPVDPDQFGAEPGFIELFEPGAAAWDSIQGWARRELRRVALGRVRELLDASGAGGRFDAEELIDRLDVDYFLRLGYALAACQAELQPSLR